MILPTYSEEKIRAELDEDHTWIVAYTKRVAKRIIARVQKTGLVKKVYEYEYRVTTPNNNQWYIYLNVDVLRHQKVQMSCNCSVESSYGTIDYYMIRGYTFGGIYFVRVTSHVISRIRERCPQCAHLDGSRICSLIFSSGEEGSGVILTDHHFIHFIEDADDRKDVCILVTTALGVFFTYQTAGYNCLIKTFISSDMIHDGMEREIYDYCCAGYIMLNQSRNHYNQEVFDKSLDIADSYRTKYGIAQTGFCLPE